MSRRDIAMESPRIPSELVKGNTRMLVLAILREGPSHGYAITHEIERRSESALVFRQGTLYPLLHELEKEGMIVGRWEVVGDERPKKVYTMTEAGHREFERGLGVWRRLTRAVDQIMRGTADDPA
ncbi:MAG: PadR family transcriptional regulator [Fimbriimonas sp.]